MSTICRKRREKWLHLHLAKIKVGVQLLVSPWKISNICSWSRTNPLIHSPCFSLPSISNSTRERVWGKWNMNFDQLGNQWLDLWMHAHVVAQIKTVGAGMFLGVFFFVSWEPWLAFLFSHQVQTTPKAEQSAVLDNSTFFFWGLGEYGSVSSISMSSYH